MAASPAKSSTVSKTPALIFGAWFSIVAVLSAFLVAVHALPLPATTLSSAPASGTWRATHALGADCGCSAYVADALIARGPRPGWEEKILLVGHQPALLRQLQAAGFAAEQLSPADFTRRTGLQGAPWLALHAPDGTTAYSGGYAPSRPGINAAALFDASIMDRVRQGQNVPAYPSFGCALSQELRSRLDPLSLK